MTDTSNFGDELDCTYLLVIQPKYLYGMNPYYQNYVMYQIHVKQDRALLTLTAVFDGSFMGIRLPAFTNAKRYRLNGVYPDDAGLVNISFDDNVPNLINLVGEKANFYTLDNHMDVEYIQDITVVSTVDNACEREEVSYEVPYRGSYIFDFVPSDGRSLKQILVDGVAVYDIIDGEPSFSINAMIDTGMMATCIKDEDGYHVLLTGISKDLTIEATFHIGDDGTISGCSRCKGYIDTSTRDYLEWVPVCHNYEIM